MSAAFGEYAQESTTKLEAGIYEAVITSATVVRDASGQLKVTENGRNQVDVMFMVDRENTVRRRYTISFGKNSQTSVYAAFAELIEAATAIKCGDKDQRKVTENELRGQSVRILLKENDRGYMDVSSTLPPSKARQQPAAQASGFAPEPDSEFDEALDSLARG